MNAVEQARHELERARSAASTEEALLATCRAWAALPSSRIAAQALTFARALPAEPVGGATQRAREERWHELAAAADPRDLQALLATPWTKRPADAIARLEKLARFPPDPRIVHALLELDTGQRFLSAAGNRFWQLAFEQLLAWGSPEAAARVPRREPPPGDPSPFAAARFAGIFEPLLASWAGRLPDEPALDAGLEQLLSALAERTRPSAEVTQRLLDAAWADPSNDAPRLVLADALSEAGDPRGEFIALQFAHERGELTLGKTERMARLLAASGRRWLDDLDGQVAPPVVFRRGFPAEVRLATRAPDGTKQAWRTVEVIDSGGLALRLSALLSSPSLAGVHALCGVSLPTLVELSRSGLTRRFGLIEVSSLAGGEVPPPSFGLDALRIRGDTETAVRWFLGTPFVSRVARLELDLTVPLPFEVTPGRLVSERPPSRLPRVGPLLGELDAKAKLSSVVLVAGAPSWPQRWAGEFRLELARDARGRLGRLSVVLQEERFDGLDVLLRGLPGDLVSSLEVRTERRLSPAARDDVTERLSQALEQQQALTERDVALARPVARPRPPVVFDGA